MSKDTVSMIINCDPMLQGSNFIVVPRLIIYFNMHEHVYMFSDNTYMAPECYK